MANGHVCHPSTLEDETLERLDALRVDDESDDELVTELINICETSEYTPFHAGE